MCAGQSWFADALHHREAQRDAGGWKVERLPVHPIDGVALMVGPRAVPRGDYEGIYGNFVLVAMLPWKDWCAGAAPQYEAGLLLRLPDDNISGLFFQGGEGLLTLRVEWSMEKLPFPMEACPPPLTTIRAEVHPLAQDEYALQFIGEEGTPLRKGNSFAPPTGDPFAGVESVTFGVPWRSLHKEQELVLSFPMAGVTPAVFRLCEAVKPR